MAKRMASYDWVIWGISDILIAEKLQNMLMEKITPIPYCEAVTFSIERSITRVERIRITTPYFPVSAKIREEFGAVIIGIVESLEEFPDLEVDYSFYWE